MGEGDTLANLKYLGLFEVTLAKWDFGEESFPVLEKLLLLGCRKLTEIPPNFGDIGSLKIIQLVESPQLEDSTLEIKQYVEDITGKDRLQILGPNDIPLSKTAEHFIAALTTSSILSSPPSRRAAAMPCTVTFLPPNTGDFSSKFFIETFKELPTVCYWKRWKLSRNFNASDGTHVLQESAINKHLKLRLEMLLYLMINLFE
ncbi:hypothetical protein BC332_14642 [Capsicum chinense]|nr:hypothetical protein BC332_14642 [Capsicum chinense]